MIAATMIRYCSHAMYYTGSAGIFFLFTDLFVYVYLKSDLCCAILDISTPADAMKSEGFHHEGDPFSKNHDADVIQEDMLHEIYDRATEVSIIFSIVSIISSILVF